MIRVEDECENYGWRNIEKEINMTKMAVFWDVALCYLIRHQPTLQRTTGCSISEDGQVDTLRRENLKSHNRD